MKVQPFFYPNHKHIYLYEQDNYMKTNVPKGYYSSKHWIGFRKPLTDDKECICEVCGSKRWKQYKRNTKSNKKGDWKKPTTTYPVHHKHYNTVGKEKRSDVIVLCSSCHTFLHEAHRMKRKGGVYDEIYNMILNNTSWSFTPLDK